MSYRLLMHSQVRDWLTALRGTEPGVARLFGEAVLALLEAGLASARRWSCRWNRCSGRLTTREVLDYTYERALEILQRVRRGVADVATSRKRVELQVSQLEQSATKLVRQVQNALDSGREDVARDAKGGRQRSRSSSPSYAISLPSWSARRRGLPATASACRPRSMRSVPGRRRSRPATRQMKASRRVREAFADIGEDVGVSEVTDAEAGASAAMGSASAAVARLGETPDRAPTAQDDSGGAGEGGAFRGPDGAAAGCSRPPADGLLFAVEPQDTAVVLAWVEDPGRSLDDYQEVIRLAASRLAMAQAAAPEAMARPPARPRPRRPPAVVAYDAESFLDEFFPGEETEVEIGAAALVARHRAHTLAEARQRMRLTQAQVAARMDVRQERVSAIERAEPGATEVRTLAAYVRALGGTLEIIADIDGERVVLR